MNDYKILIDTREKQIKHIEEQFKKNEILYIRKKLSVGDYAVEIDGKIIPVVIERKMSIDELLQNLIDCKSKDEKSKCNRFHRELIRAEALGIDVIIVIETDNYYSDILRKKYRSDITVQAARGLILALEAKYNHVTIKSVSKEDTPSFIYNLLKYEGRQYLKSK